MFRQTLISVLSLAAVAITLAPVVSAFCALETDLWKVAISGDLMPNTLGGVRRLH